MIDFVSVITFLLFVVLTLSEEKKHDFENWFFFPTWIFIPSRLGEVGQVFRLFFFLGIAILTASAILAQK